MSVSAVMRRRCLGWLLLALGPAACAQSAAVTPASAAATPAVLNEPALQSPKALGAALLAVTRAGRRLVAVGERGTVLLSDDAGTRWRQAKVPVQVTLTAVRFADHRSGWAAGHMGVILKSSDGGESWVKQLDGVQAARLIADAAGKSGDERAQRGAQRLVDEGPDKPFFDIDFSDALHGIAVGAFNLAFATADGGDRWTPIADRLPNPKGLHLYGVRSSAGHVVIVGEQGLLLKSADSGTPFSAVVSPYKGSLFGVLATRSGSLIAYGLRGNALRSTDHGANWDRLDTGLAVSISAATELEDGALALLAQTGELRISRDDGRSFSRAALATDPLPAAGLAAADGALTIATLRGMRRQPAP